jgi:hypothetical protein
MLQSGSEQTAICFDGTFLMARNLPLLLPKHQNPVGRPDGVLFFLGTNGNAVVGRPTSIAATLAIDCCGGDARDTSTRLLLTRLPSRRTMPGVQRSVPSILRSGALLWSTAAPYYAPPQYYRSPRRYGPRY